MKKFYYKIFAALTFILFIGWGQVAHRIINKNITISLPVEMAFLNWSDSLAAHGSDADNRKGSDPNEYPKHFIDIDNYPSFVSTGKIIEDYDSLVKVHGSTFVIDQGTLPWAILATYDSLKANFKTENYHRAMLFAADLGHYVGDAHMPLHLTANYNGQLTGQSGIHSRFESNMIGTYSSQIIYSGDSAVYIDSIKNYVFSFIYGNYKYVDSVLLYDKQAKAAAGSTSGTVYYSKLWELSKNFTIKLHKDASYRLACLIYSAWKDTRKTEPNSLSEDNNRLNDFTLYQNYPNPFNPSTAIKFALNSASNIKLTIFNSNGELISTLFNGYKEAGSHSISFDGSKLNSGVYFYKIEYGKSSQTRKMVIVK